MENEVRENILCGIFAALIAIGAFIKVPIPVLPFTLQFLFTNLAGLLLGRKVGSRAVGIYILIGLIGVPVFTQGGGLQYIFQPTFGYIIGFYAGTYACGHIAYKNKDFSFKNLLKASFVNLIIVYGIGMIYYYIIANYFINSPIGVYSLILYCFVLAIPGDIFLCFVSSYASKRILPIITKQNEIKSFREV